MFSNRLTLAIAGLRIIIVAEKVAAKRAALLAQHPAMTALSAEPAERVAPAAAPTTRLKRKPLSYVKVDSFLYDYQRALAKSTTSPVSSFDLNYIGALH